MKGRLLLIILTIYCQTPITAQKLNRIIFDLTRPVNELIQKNISKNDFLSDVNSAFVFIGANSTTSTILYAAGGGTIKELEIKTKRACKIINDTLDRISDAQLLIEWELYGTMIHSENLATKIDEPVTKCFHKVLFSFQNEKKCDDMSLNPFKANELHDFMRWHEEKGILAGVGFDESLSPFDCQIFSEFNTVQPIVVVHLKFGETKGVTESFGLFQARMKFLSEYVFLKGPSLHRQITLYYPDPSSVGEDEHQRLLTQFASIWTSSDNAQSSMVVQVPNSRKNASTTFSIVPHIFYADGPNVRSHDEAVWSALMLITSFQRKHPIILFEAFWEIWINQLWKIIRTSKKHKLTISAELQHVTFLPSLEPMLENLTISELEAHLRNLTFSLTTPDRLVPSEDLEAGWKSLSKYTVWCVVGEESKTIRPLNVSDVEHVVKFCKNFNVNVYVFFVPLTLEWYKELHEYSFYFENTIRKELHAVNWVRKEILKRDPLAEVYVYFMLSEIHKPPLISEIQSSNSLFCDELVPTVHQYFEGIVNWAKLERFPIIIPVVEWFDKLTFVSSWFTILRQLNYPYSEEQKIVSTLGGPAFLMQDYLKSIHPWEPDTCIHWTEKRWDILDDFFHNQKIGASFQIILNNHTISEEEYVTIFRFIFHRFRLVEISIDIGFEDMLSAVERYMAFEDFDLNTKIFLNYQKHQEDLSTYQSFLDQLIKNKIYQTGVFKGIHAELFEDSEVPSWEDVFNSSRLGLVYRMIDFGKLSNVRCGIELPSVNHCHQLLDRISSTELYSQLIDTINYIVCRESFRSLPQELSSSPARHQLQAMLDSHLFLKRVLHQLYPHLQVYFRVELDFEIGQNNATMHRYTNFLALFKIFGTEYNISYFMVDVFDNQLMNKSTGWWEIKNYSDLTNPHSYAEKVRILRGQPLWYPSNSTKLLISVNQDSTLVTVNQNSTLAVVNQNPTLVKVKQNSSLVTVNQNSTLVTVKLNSTLVTNNQNSTLVTVNPGSTLVIIVSSVSSAVLLTMVMLGICFGLRYRKLQLLSRVLSDSEVQEFLNGRASAKTEPGSMEMESVTGVELVFMKFKEEYKLDMSNISIDFDKILGSGAFGTVYKGLTKNTPAAIKRPNVDCSKDTFKGVLSEVKVLSYIGKHPNVIEFLGAYVDEIHKGVLYISTELCSRGSLEAFLRTKSNVVSRTNQYANSNQQPFELYIYELHTFALEIAQGMEYIDSRRVVHGDLATRNVLLDENLVCKIGDFGLSRKLYEYQKYVKTSQEPLPWKWMAPESLDKMIFTSKSDTWSYAVTLWEIYTLGKIPYAGLNWTVNFANQLQNGLRLPNPEFAAENIYAKIGECWNFNPDERPTFTDIINFFKNLNEDAYTTLDLTEQPLP